MAEEEGMTGGEAGDLGTVLAMPHRVTGKLNAEHSGPTKHASVGLL